MNREVQVGNSNSINTKQKVQIWKYKSEKQVVNTNRKIHTGQYQSGYISQKYDSGKTNLENTNRGKLIEKHINLKIKMGNYYKSGNQNRKNTHREIQIGKFKSE